MAEKKTDPCTHFIVEENVANGALAGGIIRKNAALKSGLSDLLKHSDKPPPAPSPEEIKQLMKSKQVRAPAEIIYNVAGESDLLPPATRTFKADRPASKQYRRENERKYLSGFDRYADEKKANAGLMES